jgi:hypothetical protein
MEKRMSTYSKAEIRSAILRAAGHIELRPDLFNFGRCFIPDCGSPGCAIGHVGTFLGMANTGVSKASMILVGWDDAYQGRHYCDREFYDRMDAISDSGWRWKADLCATTLRAYADKYFPAEKRAALDKAYIAFRASLCERVSE